MAKKHIGKFLTFAAIAGAAAAGISYFLQYKSFHKELDEEFHDLLIEIFVLTFHFTLPVSNRASTCRSKPRLRIFASVMLVVEEVNPEIAEIGAL